MDRVPIKQEQVDVSSTVKAAGDFSVSLRFICLPCGTRNGPVSSGGSKPFKYTTSKFSQLFQHYNDYHTDNEFTYTRTLRITCLVCNVRLSLKKFREHMLEKHSNCLASIICVNICLLCNDHFNFREQMLNHLLETHSKKHADSFDTNVISRLLCLFCGEKGNFDDPKMKNHQCTHIVNEDVAQFIDLTAEAGSPLADDLKCDSLVPEPAVETDTENCENAPANDQRSSIADLEVPDAAETEPDVPETVEEQSSEPFVPPLRPEKRSLADSDSCSASVVSQGCSSVDEPGKKKKSSRYNYKCGEKKCSYAHDELKKMKEHLNQHLQMLENCESCQIKFRGPIDGQIHRLVYKTHAVESLAKMTGRVVKEKKKKEKDILCNLEFDGATCDSYSYSTLMETTDFRPFVDMTYKNTLVKPIEWKGKAKQNKGWKEPKNPCND